MWNFLNSIKGELIAGVFALLGVFLGSHIAAKKQWAAQQAEKAIEFYSSFVASAISYPSKPTSETLRIFLSDAERLKLFCRGHSRKTIEQLVSLVLRNEYSDPIYGLLLEQLREEFQSSLDNMVNGHTENDP